MTPLFCFKNFQTEEGGAAIIYELSSIKLWGFVVLKQV
jgi:hypothetical protein